MFDWPKILKAFETYEPLPPLGYWHYVRHFGNAWIAGVIDVDERDEDVWKIWFTQKPYLSMPEDVCFEFHLKGSDKFSPSMKTLAKRAIRFRLLKELRKLANVS